MNNIKGINDKVSQDFLRFRFSKKIKIGFKIGLGVAQSVLIPFGAILNFWPKSVMKHE